VPEVVEIKPAKRMKNNSGNEEKEKPISKKKEYKRDPSLISFLTTYHKTMWTAKYNCKFAYENDDD
jgi:hypothetical protein